MLEYLKSLFKDLPVGIRGGIWMIIAGIFFTFIGVMIRMANKEVHVLEIVFFRYLISLIIMIPWMTRRGLHGLKAKIYQYCLREVYQVTLVPYFGLLL